MPTQYTRNFTQESYPPKGIGLLYLRARSGQSHELGIDPTNGLYFRDMDTEGMGFDLAFIPMFYRHKKQGFTASVNFIPNMDDPTKDHGFGIVIGATNDQKKVYLARYTKGAGTLQIRERDFPSEVWNTLAESTSTYDITNATEYVFEVTVTYDEATGTLTVSAYLKDTSGTTLLSLENVQITGALPLFGIYVATGGLATGYIYCKSYTVTYDGDPDTTMPDLRPILDPDQLTYDWVGFPSIVWWEDSEGKWSYRNPSDGYIYVTVRLHGEASGTGDRIDMYRIKGDPRDPNNWEFVKTVFERSPLGWTYLEEFNLLVRNDGTYIAFVAGGSSWGIHRLTSTDGGSTWTDEGVKFSDSKYNHIWVDPDGTIYLAYSPVPTAEVRFVKSTDLGQTWTQLGTLSGYRDPSLFKVGSKFYIMATVVINTDNANYKQHRLDLFETTDFQTITQVKTIVNPDSEAPYTAFHDGFFYTEFIEYNNNLYAMGEVYIVDRDLDDDFNDQTQRHLAILYDPVIEIASHFVITNYPSSISGTPSSTKTINITVENQGSADGDCKVRIKDHNGTVVAEQTNTITAGGSATFTLNITLPSDIGTYTWTIEAYNVTNDTVDDTKTFTVEATTAGPQFSITEYPIKVTGTTNETKTVNITVSNNRDVSGTCIVRIKDHNGNVVASDTKTVPANGSATYSLNITLPSVAGGYTWTIEAYNVENGTIDDTKTFTVEVTAPTKKKTEFPWWIFLLIVLGVVAWRYQEEKEEQKPSS